MLAKTLTVLALGLALNGVLPNGAAVAQEVIRHRTPGSNFPIAAAVEVPAGKTIVYLSGMVPRVTNEQAARNSIASFGDTKAQTVSVLQTIEQALQRVNLAMKDVVKMQVFLVADPAKENRMDFAGFMEGYTQFFGTTEQPNLPSRSVMAVAGLVNPGWLVEIEVTAVRP
jgi:enamine deaminase RidA (YjgF/YER057c/UK114 family)